MFIFIGVYRVYGVLGTVYIQGGRFQFLYFRLGRWERLEKVAVAKAALVNSVFRGDLAAVIA
jgi:hypothetical protein